MTPSHSSCLGEGQEIAQMLMQEAQTTQTWQGMITLALFLAGFGYLGWRRGYRREVVALLGIIFGHRVWTTSLGDKVVAWVNQTYVMARIAVEAQFDLAKMMQLTANINKIKPLITPERKEPFLFFTFLGLVLLGYAIGYSDMFDGLLQSPPSLVGALVGAVNGYLIVIWLFPTLFSVLPGAPPGRPVAARAAGGVTTRDVMAQGIKELAGIFGLDPGQLLVVVVGILVLWVAWKSR